MSYSIDANVFVYAALGASPFNRQALDFLDRCRNDSEILCLTWGTLMAFLRLATNPSIQTPPQSVEDAMDSLANLVALEQVQMITEQDGFWDVYRDSVAGHRVRGNLVPDAHLAAILRQNGVKRLYTRDADFRRFKFLDVRDPFAD